MSAGKGGQTGFGVWWWIGAPLVGIVCRLAFRLRFLHPERIPLDGRVVLAANHLSFLDGVLLALGVARTRRRAVGFLTAAEFFRHPILGFFLRRFDQIPIRRGESDVGALDEAISRIRAGAVAGIFPEGRINEGAELQRGRTGVARIALSAGAPVIPVGIWGTQTRWPKSGLRLHRPFRTPITLSFGEPIQPNGDAGSADDLARFTLRVMDGIGEAVSDSRADVEART